MPISRLVQHVDEVEESMQVQRVAMPGSRLESWTVLGDDDVPVEPVERWLAYLTHIDRSPNTVKAYAHDLKDFLVFLAGRELDWREVRLQDLGEFVAWLALPPAGRDGAVAVLPSVEPHVSAATVNRKLAALAAFYTHQSRHGVAVGELLTCWQVGGRGNGGFKKFLHHVSAGKPRAWRSIALKTPRKLPRVVTAAEMQALLDACEHLRDRLLLAILWDCGKFSRGPALRRESDTRICAAQRLMGGTISGATGVAQAGWRVSSVVMRNVDAGHEVAVGGAGGGEVFVAFLELQAQVGHLLFEVGDFLVEGVDVGGSAESGLSPGLFAEGFGEAFLQLLDSVLSRMLRSWALSKSACRETRVTAGPVASLVVGGSASRAWSCASRSGWR